MSCDKVNTPPPPEDGGGVASALFLGGGRRCWSFKALRRVADAMNVVAAVLDGGGVPDYWEKFCGSRGIPVYTYRTIEEAISGGEVEAADIGVCFLHAKIVRGPLLRFPKYGIINFHPAPLPEHKGIAGASYALLHGYKEWGVSAHYMDEGVDTGDIIKVNRFDISNYNCGAIVLARIIYEKLYALMQDVVSMLEHDGLPEGRRQDDSGHYYSHKDIEKDKLVMDGMTSHEINRRVKALWLPPFHGAFIELRGERYSLVNQEILDELAKMYDFILYEKPELLI